MRGKKKIFINYICHFIKLCKILELRTYLWNVYITTRHWTKWRKGRKEMFYLMTHSTHFILRLYGCWIYGKGYMVEETRCRHMGYSFRLTARVLLYEPSHRQDSTYHSLCYTSRGALAGTRNSSMGPTHEGLIQRPIVPWVNALTTELHLALNKMTPALNPKQGVNDRALCGLVYSPAKQQQLKLNNRAHHYLAMQYVLICGSSLPWTV